MGLLVGGERLTGDQQRRHSRRPDGLSLRCFNTSRLTSSSALSMGSCGYTVRATTTAAVRRRSEQR